MLNGRAVMNIIICGAGHVGSYSAEVLAHAKHNVTLIDCQTDRLAMIEDSLDVRTLTGNCATAETLLEAGAAKADLVVAATNNDEINLLTASIVKGLGTKSSIARVHHSTYFNERGLNYRAHFRIDHLICPEYSAAMAIARTLRNPGAMAIENFARGQIEMQEFEVADNAPAIGKRLMDLNLPVGTRLAAIRRDGDVEIARADSIVIPKDIVILVGNTTAFNNARKRFDPTKRGRRSVAIMGGPAMAVWLARSLRDRGFSLRIFEVNPTRAQELADKLEWVTVIQADPTDRHVFEEERLHHADAFVALLDDDEHNILGCAFAKSLGVKDVIAVVQQPSYLHLLSSVGIDRPFSPRRVAANEILRILEHGSFHSVSSLAEGVIDVYSVQVGKDAIIIGKPLMEVELAPHWMIAAIQHGTDVSVPGATDQVHAGDTIILIGRHEGEAEMRKLLAVK